MVSSWASEYQDGGEPRCGSGECACDTVARIGISMYYRVMHYSQDIPAGCRHKQLSLCSCSSSAINRSLPSRDSAARLNQDGTLLEFAVFGDMYQLTRQASTPVPSNTTLGHR